MFVLKKVWMVLVAATLLLVACRGQKATEVKITLKEFGIESSMTDFQAGVPYRFVVTNAGAVEHEIMLMPPVAPDSMGIKLQAQLHSSRMRWQEISDISLSNPALIFPC